MGPIRNATHCAFRLRPSLHSRPRSRKKKSVCKSTADLEQQEEQLAAHLAAKQRQAEEWSEQAKAERETLRLEKVEHEKMVAAHQEELAQTKELLAKDHQKLTLERQRVNNVYHRLRKRWQERRAMEREKHRRQSDQLEAERRNLVQQQNAWRGRETAVNDEILRFNTERELCTRQMKDERAESCRTRTVAKTPLPRISRAQR